MSMSPSRGHAAYIEDYNEDAHTTIPETRQTANVAKKRSRPEVAKPRVTDQVRDEFSDSGYSSRTGATLGSGDSSWLSKPGSATLKIDTDVIRDWGGKNGSGFQHPSASASAQKPMLRRSDSKAKKPLETQEGCHYPESGAKAHKGTTSPDKSKRQSQQHVKQALPKAVEPPSRPPSARPFLPNPVQNAPVLQPAQVRPRTSTPQAYRTARPMSFHGGMRPEFTSPYVHPVYAEQSPPAYAMPAIHQAAYTPMVSYSTSSSQSVAPYTMSYSTPQPPYAVQPSPLAPQWSAEQIKSRRRSFVHTTSPIVTSAPQQGYASATSPTKPMHHPVIAQYGPQSPSREKHYACDEDYYRMPPPPVPKTEARKPQSQRPIIRHAATTSATHATRYHRSDPIQEKEVEPINSQPSRKERTKSYEASKRPKLCARPSLASSNSASSTHDIEQAMANVKIDNNSASSKQKRRISIHGHESHKELERSVEAYQARMGSGGLPMTTESLNLIRKKTNGSNASSHVSASGKSSRAGSDIKSRSSTSRRSGSDNKNRTDNDGLTMRFNAAQGVNVDFKGASMEGRTISLRQSKDGGDGDMEFSIGAKAEPKADPKDKTRKRVSYVANSGREIEPASRSRTSKIKEESKSRGQSVHGSKSRRSSRSGR